MRITMPGEKRGAMRREPFGRPQADCAGGAGVGESGGFGATPRSPTRRCRAGSGRSAAARFALAVLLLATSGTARAQYEVDQWSADMTAGSTTLPGAIEFQGYDEDEAEGSGSLSGAEFAFHDGTTYRVSRVGTTAAQFVLRLRPPLGSSVRRDLVELEFGDTTYAFADATHTTVGTGADEASEFVWPRATAAGALANEASRFGWPGATAGTRTNGASQFVSAASTESNGRDRVRVSLVAQGTLPPLQAHEEVRLRTTMTVRYDWCHTDQLIGLPGCFYRGFHDRDSVGSMRRTYFRFDNMETDAGVQLVGVHRPSEHSGTRTLMLEVYVGFMISDEESDAADGTYTSFANALKNDGRWNLYLGNQKYAVHDADFYGYIPGTNGDSAGPARRYT